MKYIVRFPVSGFLDHEVEADSPEQAIETVLSSEYDSDAVDYHNLEADFDSNKAEVFED